MRASLRAFLSPSPRSEWQAKGQKEQLGLELIHTFSCCAISKRCDVRPALCPPGVIM